MQRSLLSKCQPIMKNIFLCIIGIAILYSCKKDNVIQNDIIGTWEYVSFVGYPFNTDPLPPGNGNIIVIRSNGVFERRSHDTTIFKGTYSIENRNDCQGDAKEPFFKTTDPNFVENVISVTHDSLLLSSSRCLADGGTVIYRRK